MLQGSSGTEIFALYRNISISEYVAFRGTLQTSLLLYICGKSFVCCFLPVLCATWYQITVAEIGKPLFSRSGLWLC